MKITYYVLLNSPYDHTFVGPFPSERRADAFATRHENDVMGAFVLTATQMQQNIKDYGEIPIIGQRAYTRWVSQPEE